MNLSPFSNLYFLGAGGIGMSALIRYFLAQGKHIAGYDRTPSSLTQCLIDEGADLHFLDNPALIPPTFRNPDTTLVVYTPALPTDHAELTFFRHANFTLLKRSQLLGEITRNSLSLCIAGTHGKTTSSSITAHLLRQSSLNCTAFLGGILKNYNSNLLLAQSPYTVAEADEFDRSFHHLNPYMAVITSAEPDHLDIYHTPHAYRDSFEHFTSLIRQGGALILRHATPITPRLQPNVSLYTYAGSEQPDAHFYAKNIRTSQQTLRFDLVTPSLLIEDLQLGVPFLINVENAVAAAALALLNGVTPQEIRPALASFAGAARRFDIRLNTPHAVLIDDYAHHPSELHAAIRSTRQCFPNRHLTGIFQPHLYSRTRDFAPLFAQVLSLLDRLILLDIYPAREQPIPGISSQTILQQVSIPDKFLVSKQQLLPLLQQTPSDLILMLGAGDIDQLVLPLQQQLQSQPQPLQPQQPFQPQP
jgi:UDP-N-acetylmuramate--alanine ligase